MTAERITIRSGKSSVVLMDANENDILSYYVVNLSALVQFSRPIRASFCKRFARGNQQLEARFTVGRTHATQMLADKHREFHAETIPVDGVLERIAPGVTTYRNACKVSVQHDESGGLTTHTTYVFTVSEASATPPTEE